MLNSTMQFPDFLSHLREIASSPLAFIGYICVIGCWVYFIWINRKRYLINSFKDENHKLLVYQQLISNKPPDGIDTKLWYELAFKRKRTIYIFASFFVTLLTIILLFALSVFKTQIANQPKVNSDDSASFNRNRASFNGPKPDSAGKTNSDNKGSFNDNDSSFNTR